MRRTIMRLFCFLKSLVLQKQLYLTITKECHMASGLLGSSAPIASSAAIARGGAPRRRARLRPDGRREGGSRGPLPPFASQRRRVPPGSVAGGAVSRQRRAGKTFTQPTQGRSLGMPPVSPLGQPRVAPWRTQANRAPLFPCRRPGGWP